VILLTSLLPGVSAGAAGSQNLDPAGVAAEASEPSSSSALVWYLLTMVPSPGETELALQTENAFLGARPNPFAGQTDLHFAVATPSRVRFSIYDVTGRLVRRLADEDMAAGEHLRSWDGRGEAGVRAAGGVYFVRLEIGDFRQTERIVLMRSGER
jgi:hypothetical protein